MDLPLPAGVPRVRVRVVGVGLYGVGKGGVVFFLFLQERRAIEVDGFELPVMSEALHAAVEHTDKLGELFEQVRKAACACTFTCTMHMTCQACWMHVQCVSEHMSIICIRP